MLKRTLAPVILGAGLSPAGLGVAAFPSDTPAVTVKIATAGDVLDSGLRNEVENRLWADIGLNSPSFRMPTSTPSGVVPLGDRVRDDSSLHRVIDPPGSVSGAHGEGTQAVGDRGPTVVMDRHPPVPWWERLARLLPRMSLFRLYLP